MPPPNLHDAGARDDVLIVTLGVAKGHEREAVLRRRDARVRKVDHLRGQTETALVEPG